MKRLFYLIAIFLVAVTSASPAFADENPPAPEPKYKIFLPMALMPVPYREVSGVVKDANDLPLAGVTVSSDHGIKDTTDANGVYALSIPQGEVSLSATYAGKSFDPQPAWLNLDQDMHNINFSAGAACRAPVPNPSFESVLYWNPISGEANGYTPVYTTSTAHLGARSGLTGIRSGFANRVSKSRWRSHEIFIPTNAATAWVSMYVRPGTTGTVLRGEEASAEVPDLSGYNTDSPDMPAAGDWQYIYVTDIYNNWLGTLMMVRDSDTNFLYTGELSLLRWRGKTIKLEFGSINDGLGGVTWAYFDDVAVTVCDGGIYTTCTNPTNLLLNSTFEAPGTGWTISDADRPSLYETTGNFFYSPLTSMQSGMPLTTTPPAGIWTTSEFYQYVTIPATTTFATVGMRLLPQSTDGWGYHILEQQDLDAKLAARPSEPLAEESQYGYICAYPYCGPNPQTLELMFRWFPRDSYYWEYREFDVTQYAGQTIGILFGAQDRGDWGNTVLYVDDVTLMVCGP